MPVLQQPEAYLGHAADIVDDQGNVKDEEAAQLLANFMTAFERWIRVVRAHSREGEFDDFMQRRQQIARDYANGETASLEAIVTQREPATFFSPRGDVQQGASTVVRRYTTDAKSFRAGGNSSLEVLQAGASGDLAVWTGLQHAEVRTRDGEQPVSMTLRITELFRLEDGAYKLEHRHADVAGPRDA